MKLFYVMGVTCVGKDYMIEYAQRTYPDKVGIVQVGKEFRRRYPPEFFQGKGAMKSTEDEAFNIFVELLNAAQDKKYVFVSGQPRLESQVDRIMRPYPGEVIWLHAPDDLLQERIITRFPEGSEKWEEARKLSFDRINNDKKQLYDVLFRLKQNRIKITEYDVQWYPSTEIMDDLIENGELLLP